MHLIVGGPARTWNVFPAWDGKTRKNLELFEMHSCHWPGAGIWLRHKRKTVTASLSLHCIDGYKSFRYWNEVFYAVFQVLGWSFLVVHLDGSVCIWIPKVIWPWMDWFCGFLYKVASFVDLTSLWAEIWKNTSIVILLDDFEFYRRLNWGVVWSVLRKCLDILAIGFWNIDGEALGLQCNFIFYLFVYTSQFFRKMVVKLFDYFWKSNSLFSKYCVNCLLMFFFV